MFDIFSKKNKGSLNRLIDDRIFSFNRSKRASEQRKGAKNSASGEGAPLDNQGADGDITIRRTSSGIVLYAKYNGAWYGVKLEKILSNSRGLSKAVLSNSTNEGLRDKLNQVIEKVNK